MCVCVCVCVCAQVGRGAERAPRPSLPHGGSTTAPHKYNNQIRRRALPRVSVEMSDDEGPLDDDDAMDEYVDPTESRGACHQLMHDGGDTGGILLAADAEHFCAACNQPLHSPGECSKVWQPVADHLFCSRSCMKQYASPYTECLHSMY